MSPSSAVVNSGKKISFPHTVNRISQYIKEKRARGETMDLFPVNDILAVVEDLKSDGQTINLFPQLSGFHGSSPKEVAATLMSGSCMRKPSNPEPSSAQMTIFYGGKVIVLNDWPSNKAKEVIDLASNLELSMKKRKLETSINSALSSPVPVQNLNSNQCLSTLIPNATDLPLKRKASLHRFLEKRRDRLVGKPRVLGGIGSSKPMVEAKSWLGLGSLPVFESWQQH